MVNSKKSSAWRAEGYDDAVIVRDAGFAITPLGSDGEDLWVDRLMAQPVTDQAAVLGVSVSDLEGGSDVAIAAISEYAYQHVRGWNSYAWECMTRDAATPRRMRERLEPIDDDGIFYLIT